MTFVLLVSHTVGDSQPVDTLPPFTTVRPHSLEIPPSELEGQGEEFDCPSLWALQHQSNG